MNLLTRPPRLLSYFHYTLIGALCLACLYLVQVGLFVIAEQQHPWITGDWLINYGSGFVRRGLSGEVIFAVSHAVGGSPAFIAAWIQLALFALIVTALLACLYRKSIGLPLLVVCFSPLTLLFPLLDVLALGRKELLVVACFACFVLTIRRPARNQRVRIAVGVTLATIATLMHELFAFYAAYFVLAELLLRPDATRGVLPWASLSILASSVVTLLALVLFGAHIDGDAVCNKLIANGLTAKSCSGAMYWQARSLTAEIAHTFTIASANRYGTVYSRGLLLALVPVLIAWISMKNVKSRLPMLAGGTVACLAWSVPLFLLAVDWGRFLHVHLMMAMFLLASLAPRTNDADEQPLSLRARAGSLVIYVFTFFVAVLSCAFWSVPHCCRASLGDGVIGMFLSP